jgi:hypothetical protein
MEMVAAGNTMVPAYLVLAAKGYEVSIVSGQASFWWTAQKGEDSFSAKNPLELLGLIAVAETRGEDWLATNAEIKTFIEKYDLRLTEDRDANK